VPAECTLCHAATLADGTPIEGDYVPSCADCHEDPDNPGAVAVADSICLGCHTRQKVEQDAGVTDVHRTAGFGCMDCHDAAEMHGDGNEYDSMLSPGASKTKCENCHSETNGNYDPTSFAHQLHAANVDCAACHVQTVTTCYACHWESEQAGAGKRFFGGPRGDFKYLVRDEETGLVTTGTMQSLTYDGQSFYVIAPFYGHSITDSPLCGDCHGSAAANEYAQTGSIRVTTWDEGAKSLTGPSGVIPIPEDFSTALIFDWVTYSGDPSTPVAETDPNDWTFLKDTTDLTQMLFGLPLTADQMDALAD
jgi:hypothetical protein